MNNLCKLFLLSLGFGSLTQMADARPLSIASKATVKVSSSVSEQMGASRINDGVMAIVGQGNWVAKDANAWVDLSWDNKQYINKVVIYNSPEESSRILEGELQFSDGSKIPVTLPTDGTAMAVEFKEKAAKSVRFVATKTAGSKAGLSEIEVFPAPSQFSEACDWVDPYIETNRGRFFLFITGQRPFGMISAAPMTFNENYKPGGGYAHRDKEILGFPQIHAWTMSGLNLMPTLGSVDPTQGENAWKSQFKHDDEIVRPGYHRVFLNSGNVWVEQTATDRVSFYKFKWTKKQEAQLLLALHGKLGNSSMTNAAVKKISNTEFEGSVSSIDRAYGVGPWDVKIYFVVKTDKPCKSFDGWSGKKNIKNVDVLSGDTVGTSMRYDVEAGEEVMMKIGVSYTSIENARKNLDAECNTWDFASVCNDTRNIWNEWLTKIEVEGGSVNQQVKFYTDLWHVLMGRHRINDINGDYPDRTVGRNTVVTTTRYGEVRHPIFKIRNTGLDEKGNCKFNMYNSDAFWLTQWNLNVLWGLAWPEVLDEFAASLVQYSNNGGLIPRGPSGGGYSFIMTGCPGTNLIVSAYMKGLLTKANAENAYAQIKKNHMPGGMMGNPEDCKFYIEKGYWRGNAGVTIETAFQDWGAAQMAKKLGKMDDYNYFMKRSASWKNCFDPETKLVFPKDEKGNFVHKDPLDPSGFVEANAWQSIWGISHDIPALSEMMGGDDVFCEKLNYAFEHERDKDYVHGYGSGYVSYANQPGCSNAHVFSYAHAPWMTQYWVRRVNEQAYGGVTPDLGWGGHDEDQGQMGGVSALMSLGLFNIVGSESQRPYYEITAPVFDKIKIKLDNKYYSGKEFVIKTYNNSDKNCYIKRAKLNGKELNNFWFLHEDFAKGGVLELWLSDKPNKNWGVTNLPPVNE